MILGANRRHKLLFITLAGMDVAWSLPWIDFMVARWFGVPAIDGGIGAALQSPLLVFLFFWGALVGYMLAADWLNRRQILSPTRELWIIGLVVLSTLLAEVILVYGPRALQGTGWLGNFASAILDFNRGLQPALVLFGYNLFLWWRVSFATGQGISFHTVGFNFRIGMLIAIFGCGVLALFGGENGSAIFYLLTFFAFGLTVSALSRLDDKAWLAEGSTGALLPWGRFVQLLSTVGITLLAALAAGALLSPAAWGVYWRAMQPVFSIFAPVGRLLIALLGWLLIPLGMALEWLVTVLREWIGEPSPPQEIIPEPTVTDQNLLMSQLLNESSTLRYIVIIVGILLALLLIWIFFVRTVAALRREEEEMALPDEPIEAGSSGERRGWRDLFGLARRYGIGRSLLAAISVQNLYANVTRLASKRGFPRPAATPPDRYLPTLEEAFPDSEMQLARLTNAYMRVHYGEVPATEEEMQQLRDDYAHVRASTATS